MTISYDNVIIFGPTGAVGSAVASEAGRRGAKVWLAMRDTHKNIPGLDESMGSFERIQADLTDARSVRDAVEKSGARAAYFYQVQGAGDYMKATLEAMKSGGVEYVVFLSSFTILPHEDIRSIEYDKIIPFAHAKVEASIEDIGLASTMLRPGGFASNVFTHNMDQSKQPWKAVIPTSARKSDCIVPEDIGHVGGACLVNRPSSQLKEIIYLYGPELLTREQMLDFVQQFSDTKIDVEVQSVDEFAKVLKAKGFPDVVVKYLLKDNGQNEDLYYANGRHEEGFSNVKKYSGHEATTFERYAKNYMERRKMS